MKPVRECFLILILIFFRGGGGWWGGVFVMLYKAVLTLSIVDKIAKCDNSNESY